MPRRITETSLELVPDGSLPNPASHELSKRLDSPGDGPLDAEPPALGAAVTHPRLASAETLWAEGRRVDEAAAWITAKIAATLRRGAEDVGEYLLDTFFSGDPQLARSKSPNKNASYRLLSEKCGTPQLPVSKSWLNNAVGIALMLRRLPRSATAFRKLPPSYQATLLPLRDPDRVEAVARCAAASDLSFRELRRVVADERDREHGLTPRSRRATPAVLKALRNAARLFRTRDGAPAYSAADVRKLDPWQRNDAHALVDQIIAELKSLASKVG